LETGYGTARIIPHLFRVTLHPPHPALERAILLYVNQYLFPFPADRESQNYLDTGILRKLDIQVDSAWMHPRVGSDQEQYELTIYQRQNDHDFTAVLEAESFFAALRGLETFSQLVQPIGKDYAQVTNKTPRYRYIINQVPITIIDQPNSVWRGALLNSARHFTSVKEIKETLDAMSWMKLNVFHWQLSDNEAFCFASEQVPELLLSASSPTSLYNSHDIAEVVEYAADRGIHVIPEIDIPGHTASWIKSGLNITLECPGGTQLEVASENTYYLLRLLFQELDVLFPDNIPFHIGGRDIDLDCWADNSLAKPFWDAHSRLDKKTVKSLGDFFYKRVLPIFSDLSRAVIVWSDLLDESIELPSHVFVQCRGSSLEETVANAINFGHQAILSLHHENTDTGESSYTSNINHLQRTLIYGNVLGGEGLFSSQNPDPEKDSAFWPSSAEFAGSLWVTHPEASINTRAMNAWLCRAQRRGVLTDEEVTSGSCGTRSPDLQWAVDFKKYTSFAVIDFFMTEADYKEDYQPAKPSPWMPVKAPPKPAPNIPPRVEKGHLAGDDIEPGRGHGYLLWLVFLLGGILLGTGLVRWMTGRPCKSHLLAGWSLLSLVAIVQTMGPR